MLRLARSALLSKALSPPPLRAEGTPHIPTGMALLRSPLLNKGTAFTKAERDQFRLRGLLPTRVTTLDKQLPRVLEQCRRFERGIDKYIYLTSLQARNETLFYRLLVDNLEELMPVVYTPTVGEACRMFGGIFRNPRGLYISSDDMGSIASVLRNWHVPNPRLICVTDGERILGLGDLGANGMGIPVGKLSLYSACAGVHPSYTLPITLDVGCNRAELRDGPLYLGDRKPRIAREQYNELIDEFMTAVRDCYPGCVVQFEDFGSSNAFRLLERFRTIQPCFNDDIQGTAAVALAGVLSALRITGTPLQQQRLFFVGAGEAGTGIGELYVAAATQLGMSEADARRRCVFFDSTGLLNASRPAESLAHHKRPFAHEGLPDCKSLLEAIEHTRPTVLIGVSGVGKQFTEPVVRAMARMNERPVIFALSNPTSQSECTAEEAYRWSNGSAIFASGSPFPPVQLVPGAPALVPGQGNNVYVFPGVGLGVLAFNASRVSDAMFLAAAQVIAGCTTDADLKIGRVYPSLSRIRDVSLEIAVQVGEAAYREGVAGIPKPKDMHAHVRACMWDPVYPNFA